QHKEGVYRRISGGMTRLAGLTRFLCHCDAAALQTVVVTNAPRVDAFHTLEVLGLTDRFAASVTIGMECSAAKPSPEPYLEGLRKLGDGAGMRAAECVAFEDSPGGITAAVAAGIFTIGVTTGWSEEQLKEFGCGLAIRDFDDERLWRLL
ncbi:unnamed protein product, partial [Phaeothamnion confervicola]